MSITPITTTHPACLGVMCEQHKDCQRYHLVEQIGSDRAIWACHDDKDEYPFFVPMRQEAEEA